MAKRDFRYRRWRDDRFGHAKTGGMRPTSYFLEDLAAGQNILGVLQHSPRAIAERFGRVPVKQITDAIAELVERGSARWWPELETLWVVEVLDEQSDGPKVDVHAAKMLPTLALPVQLAIRERYGARVELPPQTPSDTQPDRVSEGVCPPGIRKQEQEAGEQVSTPVGVSPTSPPSAELEGHVGGQVLTHPTADPSAGTIASQRKRAATELWTWHEGERTRRLLAGQHQPRQATDKFLGPVLRLHAHVRKAYGCDEAEGWRRIREYREARLADTEQALLKGHSEANKWRAYAAGEAAWSTKGFDYLAERGPDPKAAQAAADEAYQAEVRRLKDIKRQQQGGAA